MALGSLVDKPLMQNPLAGGGAPQIIDPSVITPRGGAPKTDDPIMQGFYNSEFYKPNASTTMDVVNYTYQGKPMQGSSSNISQIQQYLDSIGKGDLIQRNDQIFSQETGPLAVGDQQLGPLDLSKINKNPYNTEFIGIGKDQTNLFGYKVPDEVIAEQEERMKNNPINMYNMTPPSELDLILSDPQGGDQLNDTVNYGGSDVGPNVGNEIAVPSTPNPIQGIGLDGKPIGQGLQDLVSPATPPTPTIPKLDGTVGFPVTVSGDDSIATTATANPYQEQFTGFSNQLTGFGDQLTGFGDQFSGLDKQFNTINTRLDNVDEGIAGLSEQLQPQQQLYNSPYSNFNFRTNSYSNPSPFGFGGLGSLFMRRY